VLYPGRKRPAPAFLRCGTGKRASPPGGTPGSTGRRDAWPLHRGAAAPRDQGRELHYYHYSINRPAGRRKSRRGCRPQSRPSGTSFVTTLPAPTVARSPIHHPAQDRGAGADGGPPLDRRGTHSQSASSATAIRIFVARKPVVDKRHPVAKNNLIFHGSRPRTESCGEILHRLPTRTPFWIRTKRANP